VLLAQLLGFSMAIISIRAFYRPSPQPLSPVNILSLAGGNTADPLPDVDVVAAAAKYGWDLQCRPDWSRDARVQFLPVAAICRPLRGIRPNDSEKVAALMRSITEIGQLEPIDVLEVDGVYWGFSGCHRYEAHVKLGRENILCRIRKATPQTLKFHLM